MDDTPGLRASAGQRLKAFWHSARLWFIFLAGLAAIVAVLSLPQTPGQASVGLSVGDVAEQDVLAPSAMAYTSSVLTLDARQTAASAGADVYDPPDSRLARQQYERLRAAPAFLGPGRAARYATPEQKLA